VCVAGGCFTDVVLYSSKKSKRVPFIFNDESTGSYICRRVDLYMSHVKKYNRYARHIHDPVLSSLKMKGTRLLFSLLYSKTNSCTSFKHTFHIHILKH
jgi:hypothetical protein